MHKAWHWKTAFRKLLGLSVGWSCPKFLIRIAIYWGEQARALREDIATGCNRPCVGCLLVNAGDVAMQQAVFVVKEDLFTFKCRWNSNAFNSHPGLDLLLKQVRRFWSPKTCYVATEDINIHQSDVTNNWWANRAPNSGCWPWILKNPNHPNDDSDIGCWKQNLLTVLTVRSQASNMTYLVFSWNRGTP